MQFEGGYRYPAGTILKVLSVIALLTGIAHFLLKQDLPKAMALFFNLEGTILLVSAFTPKGLVPPQGNFINRIKWFFFEQGGVAVSLNQPVLYGGMICLIVSIIISWFLL